jgi:hypothetical protein
MKNSPITLFRVGAGGDKGFFQIPIVKHIFLPVVVGIVVGIVVFIISNMISGK